MLAVVRGLGLLVGVAAVLVLAARQGPGTALAVGLGLALAWFVARIWLPRAAHGAFRAGEFVRAGRRYRVLAAIRLDPTARAAARVSRVACRIGREDFVGALGELAAAEPRGLSEALRAAWLNNRAYALARTGEAARALALADEVVALRPDVPGFRHTRGVALLGLGRLDDAIRELDEVWRRSDERAPTVLLEAERCFDLGQAWSRRGELGHAAEYFERARRSAPTSVWARRASEHLPAGLGADATLDAVL